MQEFFIGLVETAQPQIRLVVEGVLELVNMSFWRELPSHSELRFNHLAFPISRNQKKLLCGMFILTIFKNYKYLIRDSFQTTNQKT